MYSDADLEAAIAAGALTPEAAAALRAHVATADGAPSFVDEEHFRLITGFNDIFVSIAAVLLLVAVGWIGKDISLGAGPSPFSGLLVAATAWGLAEFFTRKRRMALPSIILLLAFVGGVFGTAVAALTMMLDGNPGTTVGALMLAACAFITAIAAYLHWRRFKVPITIAAGTAATTGLVMALILSAVGATAGTTQLLTFIGGIAIFAFAMWWDMSDPSRQTRRSDVAFWLHLLAAPMIVHPAFTALGLLGGGAGVMSALVVILLYALLGIVALLIDRRALMVSALFYVLFAFSILFREFGAVSFSLALTALVIGSALLLLSAFWHVARGRLLRHVSPGLRDRLPHQGRAVSSRPA